MLYNDLEQTVHESIEKNGNFNNCNNNEKAKKKL